VQYCDIINSQKNGGIVRMKPRIHRGWLRALIFFISSLLIFVLSQNCANYIVKYLFSQYDVLLQGLINRSIILVFILLTVYFFRKFIDNESFISLGFTLSKKAKDILHGIALGFVLMAICFIFLSLTNQIKIIEVQLDPRAILLFFIIFFIVSLIEEVLFRGYLLINLMESYNKYIALVITAVLFSAVHLTNPYLSVLVIFNLLLIGYLFGIYYIHVRNLWFSIFLHASWSFFQVAIFGFPIFGMKLNPLIKHQFQGSSLLTGTKFGLEGSILITILTILSIFYLEKIYRRRKKEG
jgi:membrane protease YdiL (CAAX protease family)